MSVHRNRTTTSKNSIKVEKITETLPRRFVTLTLSQTPHQWYVEERSSETRWTTPVRTRPCSQPGRHGNTSTQVRPLSRTPGALGGPLLYGSLTTPAVRNHPPSTYKTLEYGRGLVETFGPHSGRHPSRVLPPSSSSATLYPPKFEFPILKR